MFKLFCDIYRQRFFFVIKRFLFLVKIYLVLSDSLFRVGRKCPTKNIPAVLPAGKVVVPYTLISPEQCDSWVRELPERKP